MFRNRRLKAIETENETIRGLHQAALDGWDEATQRWFEARNEVARLKAELLEAEETMEKMLEEITELKAKYTAEVQKNYEFVQKIDMLEG